MFHMKFAKNNKEEVREEKVNDEKVKFDTNSICVGHHNITYRGVKAIRCPFDYVLYQMILYEIKPDLVIEIGTNIGGGALYIADILDVIRKGVVHTIDIQKQSDDLLLNHKRIRLFTEGWEKYDIKEAAGFNTVLVIEDASHIYENTLNSINKFAPLVSVNSYLIVEDGIVNELGMSKEYHGGPLKAINEFMKINNNFIIDRKWCDFFGKNATFNVNGYLKKIK
ncbi:MAG: CmcI family methyltransferase [Patescibacteria group bacterium]